MAYTGIDFSDLKNSIFYQQARGEKIGFELRRFTDPGNWNNPGGILSNIGPDGLVNGQQPYLQRMPREQLSPLIASEVVTLPIGSIAGLMSFDQAVVIGNA